MLTKMFLVAALTLVAQTSVAASTSDEFQVTGFGCFGNPGWDMGSVIAARSNADERAQRICSPREAKRASDYEDQLLDLDCQRSGKDGFSSSAKYTCK